MPDHTDRTRMRRDLLKGLAAGTLAAAASLVVSAPRKAWAIPETKEVREKSTYRVTEHVRRFYQTNRY